MIEKQQLRVMTLGKGDREQQFKIAFAMPTPVRIIQNAFQFQTKVFFYPPPQAWFVNGLYKLLFLCQEELPTTDEVIDSLIYLRCQNSHFQVSYIGLSALHIFREVFLEIELLSALFDKKRNFISAMNVPLGYQKNPRLIATYNCLHQTILHCKLYDFPDQ